MPTGTRQRLGGLAGGGLFERLCACIPASGAVDHDISLVEVVV